MTSGLPALSSIDTIVSEEAREGTGADIITRIEGGKPPSLHIGFRDLGWRRSPRVTVAPHGMHAYRINLEFGNFSRSVFERMNSADDESHELAISLFETLVHDVKQIEFTQPTGRRWELSSDFRLSVVSTRLSSGDPEQRIRHLARAIIAPVLSAMAELNGYDAIGYEKYCDTMEGAVLLSLIQRRERNPRNKMLALRIHGSRCKVCQQDHGRQFGFLDSLVEVHHCQPLSLQTGARAYDPKTDLVPLCPTCHRAAHRRRPLPYQVEELRAMLSWSAAEIS